MYRPDDIGDSSYVRCGFRDCNKCCLGTEMILSENEVELIELNTEFKRNEFLLAIVDVDGFLQLKNIDSPLGMKCFFLSDKGKCSIYKYAPQGCRMYPLILNVETDETIIDIDCRERLWFKNQNYYESQIITVKKLVSTLLLENEQRIEELKLYPSDITQIESIYFEDSEASADLKALLEDMQDAREEEEED